VTPRRVVLQGAAWTIPVLATAVGAPLVAASTRVPPGITVTATHTEWNSEWNHYRTPDNTFRGSSSGSSVAAPTCSYSGDQKQYNGWIADGISMTLGDANGKALANTSVTFTISGKEKQFWFVKNPCVSESTAWNDGSPNNLRSITLKTDSEGFIALDGGTGTAYRCATSGSNSQLIGYNGFWGYLRKGQDDSTRTTLTVSAAGQASRSISIWNYTPTSNPYELTLWWPGLRMATATSPCPMPTAP
jgi:hypothetical protein